VSLKRFEGDLVIGMLVKKRTSELNNDRSIVIVMSNANRNGVVRYLDVETLKIHNCHRSWIVEKLYDND